MADQTINSLFPNTTPASDDLLHIINDPTGTPQNQKIALSDLLQEISVTAAETSAGVTPTDLRYPEGNVLRYGANTTPGTTDMTTAIQAALDVGVDVFIPKDTFLVSATGGVCLTVSANTVISGVGEGSIIKMADSQNGTVFLSTSSDILFRAFSINGNKSNQTGTGRAGILVNHTNQNIDNILIENIHMENMQGFGVYIVATGGTNTNTNTRIINNVIENTTQSAIQLDSNSGTAATIRGPVIRGNAINEYGLEVNAQGISLNNGVENGAVVGNFIFASDSSISAQIVHGINIQNNTDGSTVVGNNIDGGGKVDKGISLSTLTNGSTVSGNIVRNVTGIGIEVVKADYTTVSGNLVDIAATATSADGIFVADSAHCSVTGNALKDVGADATNAGIRVDSDATNTTTVDNLVSSNTIIFPSTGQIRGIVLNAAVSGTTSRNLVIGNNIRGNNVSGSHGIRLLNAGTMTDNDVKDNYISNVNVGLSDAGTTSTIRNNRGWVTENSGTGSITSGGTTDVITHGLAVTPTAADIRITLTENPDNTPGAIFVDTITSTQFTVNCENDPGASNLDFSWQAVVL